MTLHRWVRHERVPDFLRCGWLALPSLEGTHHGFWSAHCVWLCECPCATPANDEAIRIKGPNLSVDARAAIQRVMQWEDDSWRDVMGTEPPWLKA